MKKAFITGITGQDGSYLAELLVQKGYEVHGLVRRHSQYIPKVPDTCIVHYGDMTAAGGVCALIQQIQPDEVYNLAAQSQVGISFKMPEYTAEVNGLGALRILEAVHAFVPGARVYQASTSELFGKAPAPQNENTSFSPRSPYACAKLHAFVQVKNHREAYDMFACNGILFNHESPRRGEDFVTRKIAKAAARIKHGLQSELCLGRLDTQRDWGWAPEYVEAMWLMLQADAPDDFVVATGITHTVKDFVAAAFQYVDLEWEDYVKYDAQQMRPLDVSVLRGDASKAEKVLGWKAQVSFSEIVSRMVYAETELIAET